MRVSIIGLVLLLSGCFSKSESQSSVEANACARAYEKFYQADVSEIVVAFGYKDARPARFVGDRYERTMLVQHLVRSCGWKDDYACGFDRAVDDADLFLKRVRRQRDQQQVLVRLRIVHSSAGEDDSENRRNPFQKWQSRRAEEAFLEGVESSQAVLYNGHSRDGGGPDFEPPRIDGAGQVAYAYYRENQPGLNRLLTALKASKESCQLLGLFSCVSDRHFKKRILQARSEIGLITNSRLLYFSDALEHTISTLSSLLGQRCEEEFRRRLQSPSTKFGSELEGFFRK